MSTNMSVNSSSIADPSSPPPHLSSNSSLDPLDSVLQCFSSKMSACIFSIFSIIHVLLLPLLFLVLYLGFQQWRRQRSVSTAAASHSDLLTYHSIAMQMNQVFGFTFFLCGYVNRPVVMFVGFSVYTSTSLGQTLFHVLTCVDCYLAVVHPITYLRLKQSGGVRIRNITIGCVWLLSAGYLPVTYFCSSDFNFFSVFYAMCLFLIVVSFCCISVLCALRRPGPGEVGGNRERGDQSKRRAFHIIVAVTGALVLRFGGNLLCSVMYTSSVFSNICVVFFCLFGFDMPSRLVLPLLFLRRAGKLQFCPKNPETG